MEEAVLAHVRSFFEWLWAHLVKVVEGGGGGGLWTRGAQGACQTTP